jgi:hypothetical protein
VSAKPRVLLVTCECPARSIIRIMDLSHVGVIDIRHQQAKFQNNFYDIEIVETHMDAEQWLRWKQSLDGRPTPNIRIHSCLEDEVGMKICLAEIENYRKRSGQ